MSHSWGRKLNHLGDSEYRGCTYFLWNVSVLNYYPLALTAFKAARGLGGSGQAEVARALHSRKEFVRTLRGAYDRGSYSSTVSLDYQDELADAYLLAYFPGNVVQSKMAFDFAGVAGMAPAPQRVGLFCCGLAPEAVALAELLAAARGADICEQCFLRLPQSQRREADECPHCGKPIRTREIATLHFHLFDHSPGWSQLRDAVMKHGCQDLWGGPVQYDEVAGFDMLTGLTPEQELLVPPLDLAVFQNFDNEMGPNKGRANQTVLRVSELLRPGSKLILSDLFNSRRNHEHLLVELQRRGLGSPSISPRGQRAWHGPPDDFLRRNLLDGSDGLKPRIGTSHWVNILVLDRG